MRGAAELRFRWGSLQPLDRASLMEGTHEGICTDARPGSPEFGRPNLCVILQGPRMLKINRAPPSGCICLATVSRISSPSTMEVISLAWSVPSGSLTLG